MSERARGDLKRSHRSCIIEKREAQRSKSKRENLRVSVQFQRRSLQLEVLDTAFSFALQPIQQTSSFSIYLYIYLTSSSSSLPSSFSDIFFGKGAKRRGGRNRKSHVREKVRRPYGE